MKRLFLATATCVFAAGTAQAASYYCFTATDGWRFGQFNINPADLNEKIAGVDPLARYLYVSCLGTFSGDSGARVLDCAILDDIPTNVLAAGQIEDGEEQLVVKSVYDGREQSVTCTKRHPRP